MIGRRLAWLVALPLVVAGVWAGHQAAYLLVEPQAHGRDVLLAETGHGYMDQAPLALLALGVIGLAALAGQVLRPDLVVRLGALPFALAPPVAFTLQEHLERLVHTGQIPLDAVAEPTFAIGLLMQAPFALVAWLTARLLLRAATAAGLRLWRLADLPLGAPVVVVLRPRGLRPRRSVLALRGAGRAPPLPG